MGRKSEHLTDASGSTVEVYGSEPIHAVCPWAVRATTYLRTLQNSDGGFAYYKGGSSEVNSTGLAMAALRPQAGSTAVAKRLARASKYPGTVRTAVRALKAKAAEYTGAGSDASPAALGTLLQVAAVTANPTPSSFGGVNLTKELRSSIRR